MLELQTETSPLDSAAKIKCEMCEKIIGKRHMRSHVSAVHLKLKPYQCDQCATKFSTRGSLNVHMVIHSDERNIKCPDCDKTFKTNAFLKRHSLIHLEVKPYFCDECGKSFADPSYFKCHKKEQHSGSFPFKCRSCEKSFRIQKSLRLHIKTHSPDYAPKPRFALKDAPNRTYTEALKEEILKRVDQIGTSRTAREQGVNKSVIRSWLNIKRRKYKCEKCDRCFKDSHLLKMHTFGQHTKQSENRNAWSFDNNFRETVVEYVKEHSMAEASRKFDIVERTIQRWVTLFANGFICSLCEIVFNRKDKITAHLSKKHKIVDPSEQVNNFKETKTENNPNDVILSCSDTIKGEYSHSSDLSSNKTPLQEIENDDLGNMNEKNNFQEKMKAIIEIEEMQMKPQKMHRKTLKDDLEATEDSAKVGDIDIFTSLCWCFFKCIFFCLKMKQRIWYTSQFQINEEWETPLKEDTKLKDVKKELNTNEAEELVTSNEETIIQTDMESQTIMESIQPGFLKNVKQEDELENHLTTDVKTMLVNPHDDVSPNVITKVEDDRRTEKILVTDMKEEHKPRKRRGLFRKCPFCEKQFNDVSKLKYHYNTHTKERPFVCDVCQKSFNHPRHLKRHLPLHEEKTIVCHHCPKTFADKSLLDLHLRYFDQSFQCNICGNVYAAKDNLKAHERRKHTGERPYCCSQCGDKFIMNYQLKEHINKVHSDNKDIPKQMFVCEVCGKGYRRKNIMLEHANTHSGEPTVVCEICQQTFNTKATHRHHMKKHEKKYECNQCGKCFGIQRNFDAHKKVHSGIKDFQCSNCPKAYSSMRSLQMHMEIKHNVTDGKKKVFSCEKCEKMYTRAESLERHMKKH